MFNSPYNKEYWNDLAENIEECLPSLDSIELDHIIQHSKAPTIDMLKWASKRLSMTIIGGSIPYKEGVDLFNRCLIFENGEQLDHYDKLHLFDIDIPGRITYKESETLTPGSKICTFDHKGFKIGVGICYDVRFPTLSQKLRSLGCDMLVFPAVFNFTTGPLHFELLARGRASDNQCFIAMCSNATNYDEKVFQCWGHSMIVDPYGKKLGDLGHDELVLTQEIDLDLVKEVRKAIPISVQVRKDIIEKE